MGLSACYAVSGTDVGYAAIRRGGCGCVRLQDMALPSYAVPGTDLGYAPLPSYAVPGTKFGFAPLLSYAFAMRCPVLTYCMMLARGSVLTEPPPTFLRVSRALFCTDLSHAPCMVLRASHAMSGTELGCAATLQTQIQETEFLERAREHGRACCGRRGASRGSQARTCDRRGRAMRLRACYAMSGTHAASAPTGVVYANTRLLVLTRRMLLGACYAVSGTDVAYAATRMRRVRARGWRLAGSTLPYAATHSLCDICY
eukprot:2893730-Rhodomonas_salina.11